MALAQQVSYATAVAPCLLPFRELLRDKVPWHWDSRLDEVFAQTRQLLADKVEEGIMSFDPSKPTALLTDWCKHGVGFVMMQKQCSCPLRSDGSQDLLCCNTGWQVSMVGSRFTHTAEANYSATEGELLAQVDALQKKKYFTLGCPHLILGTDHMPLLGLLSNRNLDSIDNPRLVRLKQKTLGWQFTVVYIPGKKLGGTDALSRYGVRHCPQTVGEISSQPSVQSSVRADDSTDQPSVRQHLIGLLASATLMSLTSPIPTLLDTDTHFLGSLSTEVRPVTWEEIKQMTSRDAGLQSLSKLVQTSFPDNRKDLPPELQQYWTSRTGLTVHDGVVLYNDRPVIPPSARARVLQVLHSAHQGVTGMSLRAEQAVYWPGMSHDIRETRANCRTCHTIAPSQSDMPPVQPITPAYPFQHICADYFSLHGRYFGVIVDRFSGWFNVYAGKGGADCLVDMMTRLFQDMGVPDSVTSDGGPEFKSDKFKSCLRQYGVQHRLTSVGFAHANTRAELAVKTAKRMLRDNMSPTGGLDNVAVTRAVLQYRNTPDRDTGLSPAYMLLGRQLKDFLPSKPNHLPPLSSHKDLSATWQNVAEWRELALAKRSAKDQENLSEHVKDHAPLALGDHVMVQNQVGNNPKRWEKRGVIVNVLPNRQYQVRLDGSRRLTLRNRKFLRKFSPIHGEPTALFQQRQQPAPSSSGSAGERSSQQNLQQPHQPSAHPTPAMVRNATPALITPQSQMVPTPDAAQSGAAQSGYDQSGAAQPSVAQPRVPHHEQSQAAQPQPAALPDSSVPLPALMHPVSPTLRRSGRINKGITSKYDDYRTGAEFDASVVSTISPQYPVHPFAQNQLYLPTHGQCQQWCMTPPNHTMYAQPILPLQHHPQNMNPMYSQQDIIRNANTVWMINGNSDWKEYYLENISSS